MMGCTKKTSAAPRPAARMAGSCVTRPGRLSVTGGDQRDPHGADDRLDEGDLILG